MAESSVIGSTTVIRGHVRGEGDIEIYGRVDGDVTVTGNIALGDEAEVRGRLTGASVSVGGTVTGDITASIAVSIGAQAHVVGDLISPRVGIAEGARVRGGINTEGGGSRPMEREAIRRSEPRRDTELRRAPVPPPSRAEPAAAPLVAKPRTVATPPITGKRKPPPPVVPALRKGTRARKKAARR